MEVSDDEFAYHSLPTMASPPDPSWKPSADADFVVIPPHEVVQLNLTWTLEEEGPAYWENTSDVPIFAPVGHWKRKNVRDNYVLAQWWARNSLETDKKAASYASLFQSLRGRDFANLYDLTAARTILLAEYARYLYGPSAIQRNPTKLYPRGFYYALFAGEPISEKARDAWKKRGIELGEKAAFAWTTATRAKREGGERTRGSKDNPHQLRQFAVAPSDWGALTKHLALARYAGLLPLDQVYDKRITAGVQPSDPALLPTATTGQARVHFPLSIKKKLEIPVKIRAPLLVLFSEKGDQLPTFEALAKKYYVYYYVGAGHISIAGAKQIWDFIRANARVDTPVIILTFTDLDESGALIPAHLARKLQWLIQQDASPKPPTFLYPFSIGKHDFELLKRNAEATLKLYKTIKTGKYSYYLPSKAGEGEYEETGEAVVMTAKGSIKARRFRKKPAKLTEKPIFELSALRQVYAERIHFDTGERWNEFDYFENRLFEMFGNAVLVPRSGLERDSQKTQAKVFRTVQRLLNAKVKSEPDLAGKILAEIGCDVLKTPNCLEIQKGIEFPIDKFLRAIEDKAKQLASYQTLERVASETEIEPQVIDVIEKLDIKAPYWENMLKKGNRDEFWQSAFIVPTGKGGENLLQDYKGLTEKIKSALRERLQLVAAVPDPTRNPHEATKSRSPA